MALLDDVMYDGGHIKEEDKIGVERGECSAFEFWSTTRGRDHCEGQG